MLATHSRLIEGELFDVFHRNGWNLMAEESVFMRYLEELSDQLGMTVKDESMFWVNKRVKK